ncbi:15710_t:CDS:1, partial [Cetraspora pellucida]
SWNAREKLAIITYIKKNPNASKQNTAEQFDIQPVQLHKWIKNKEQLISSPQHIR